MCPYMKFPFDLLCAVGSCFVRTDQLDGETDWKLRVAVPSCQQLQSEQVSFKVQLFKFACVVYLVHI